MKKSTALLALVMLASTTAAFAKSSGGERSRGGQVFNTTTLFTELDQNGDQYISATELTDLGLSGRMVRRADNDGDTLINATELSEARFSKRADADADGAITLAELLDYQTNRPKRGKGERHEGGHGKGERAER